MWYNLYVGFLGRRLSTAPLHVETTDMAARTTSIPRSDVGTVLIANGWVNPAVDLADNVDITLRAYADHLIIDVIVDTKGIFGVSIYCVEDLEKPYQFYTDYRIGHAPSIPTLETTLWVERQLHGDKDEYGNPIKTDEVIGLVGFGWHIPVDKRQML